MCDRCIFDERRCSLSAAVAAVVVGGGSGDDEVVKEDVKDDNKEANAKDKGVSTHNLQARCACNLCVLVHVFTLYRPLESSGSQG